MTRVFWPAPHIHLAQVGDDIVVLDTEADAYHCLLDAAHWMTICDDGRIAIADEEGARALEGAGFCTPRPRHMARGRPVPPSRQLVPACKTSWLDIITVAHPLFRSTLACRGQPLGRMIAPIPLQTPHPRSSARPQALIATAKAALPWIPMEGECLQRAFQLRRLFASRGIGVTWMFGVRTWPFAAHCWLQIDDMVVGDTVERVARYVPIMAA